MGQVNTVPAVKQTDYMYMYIVSSLRELCIYMYMYMYTIFNSSLFF